MSDEITPAGSPDLGAPPALRASHQDRDRAVDVLRIAAGDGRLTAEELDERLEAALSARTVRELVALTADLPTVPTAPATVTPEVKDVIRIEQQGGSVRRADRWVLPRRLELRSSWSKVTLDFTDAVIAHSALRIDMDMRGGSLTLVTRPGVVVDTDSLTAIYAKVNIRHAADAGTPVLLRVELVGRISHGRVVSRSPHRTLQQRLRRLA